MSRGPLTTAFPVCASLLKQQLSPTPVPKIEERAGPEGKATRTAEDDSKAVKSWHWKGVPRVPGPRPSSGS